MARIPSISVALLVLSAAIAAGPSAPQAARPAAPQPLTREQRERELAKEVAKQPGWKLHETAHYFLLTPVTDATFVERVKTTSEEIRRTIREDFPHPDLDPVPIETAPSAIRL